MVKIVFITGSEGKYREAKYTLSSYGIEVLKDSSLSKLEIQSNSLEEIVKYAIKIICSKYSGKDYLMIEDDGLFVKVLNGFPGPYSAYIYKTIGLKGVLKLLENIDNREAYFKSVIGLCTSNGEIKTFTGEVYGVISKELRGSSGFGYDPIFIPENYDKTFAELSINEKCRISHRARALFKVGEFIRKLS